MQTMTQTYEATTTQRESLAKFRALLHEFSEAMLVTRGSDGRTRAQPMRIAALHHEVPDDLWLFTSLDNGQLQALREYPEVALTMSDGKRHVSISGTARPVVAQEQIEQLWQETWRVWFPEGPVSPDILLIQVRFNEAEYWDQSFPRSARVAFEAVKALTLDAPFQMPEGPDYHAKLQLAN